MPGVLRYIPPTDPKRSSEFALQILNEKTARHKLYHKAVQYYKGKQTPQLLVEEDQPDDNVVINMVKTTTDRTASFLFPDVPAFETDRMEVEQTDEEAWIRATFENSGGLNFLIKTAQRGFLSGHNFVKVTPPRAWEKYARFTLLDPLAVTVYWNADDIGEILWYEHRYVVGREVHIKDYVRDLETGLWRIYHYRSRDDLNEDDDAWLGELLAGVPGPYGMGYRAELRTLTAMYDSNLVFEGSDDVYGNWTSLIPPIIAWEHLPDPDNFYGQAESDHFDLQDTINRVWSEINRIVREHSDPLDIVTGADVDDVVPYDDRLLTIAQVQARVQRMELRGDLGAAVDTVKQLVETYLSLVRVVILKGDVKDLQRVTNAAVRTLFIDAISKNTQLQSSYGKALIQMARLALLVGRGAPSAAQAEDMEINIQWESALPVDKVEVANNNAIGVNSGWMSRRTAATEYGLNWSHEQTAMQAEEEAAMQQQQAKIEAGLIPDPQAKPEPPGNSGVDNQE